MSIKSVYKEYYQKSRLFLYPALKIRRGVSIKPIQTYMSWDGLYSLDDCKLICTYYVRDDAEFKNFERKFLMGNPLFETFIPLENNGDTPMAAYVFDFSEYKDTYKAIAIGRYSETDPGYKIRILAFFGNDRTHVAYMESYLYPQRYFSLYAKLLTTEDKDVDPMRELLTEVGELCTPPNVIEEHLTTEPETLNIDFDSVNLSINKNL
jgi:hypothetical protein